MQWGWEKRHLKLPHQIFPYPKPPQNIQDGGLIQYVHLRDLPVNVSLQCRQQGDNLQISRDDQVSL